MSPEGAGNLSPIPAKVRQRKLALDKAMAKMCSEKWILRQWGRFIKERDACRCLCCGSERDLHAHHIVRKTIYPGGAAQTGNGITLCRECHGRVHENSNGRADLSTPLGEADDQDEWAFLFGLLLDDARQRGLDQGEFYFLCDHMLQFFVSIQGYRELHGTVMRGEVSRLRFAHEIFRAMPEAWYVNFVAEAVTLNV